MQNILTIRFSASTHVLVRPISLDTLEVDGSRKCDPNSVWRLGAAARSLQGRNRPKPVSGNPPGPTK